MQNSLQSQQEAAKELLRRKEARGSFRAFIELLDLGYTFAAHQLRLIEELETVARGDVHNLMVFMPPGSAKSTYSSVLFPPWFMGNHPETPVIGVSNTTDLAERFSRRARNIVDGSEFRRVFGEYVKPESSSAGYWETTAGGEYYAAGMGAAISGRRAGLGLIDDPIKTRQEADSDRVLSSQWEWYLNDFLPRLKPGARQILIMTRWRENDLAGRILERERSRWRIVEFPMEAVEADDLGRQPGDRLWADYFTDEMVATAKLDPRSWSALYQQKPMPDEGIFFQRDWFSEYDAPPTGLRILGASDYALTDGAGDWTELGLFGMDPQSNLYVLDWWYGKKSADFWIERQLDLIARWRPQVWLGEGGPARRAVEPFLIRRMTERKAFCQLEWLPSITEKEARARPIQALASVKMIAFPKNTPGDWKAHVMKQLLEFPAGAHDDVVDVFSLIGRGLEHLPAPRPPRPQRVLEPAVRGWTA